MQDLRRWHAICVVAAHAPTTTAGSCRALSRHAHALLLDSYCYHNRCIVPGTNCKADCDYKYDCDTIDDPVFKRAYLQNHDACLMFCNCGDLRVVTYAPWFRFPV